MDEITNICINNNSIEDGIIDEIRLRSLSQNIKHNNMYLDIKCLTPNVPVVMKELLELIERLGLSIQTDSAFYENRKKPFCRAFVGFDKNKCIFISTSVYVSPQVNKQTNIGVNVFGDASLHAICEEIRNKYNIFKVKDENALVYLLTQEQNGFALRPAGHAGHPIDKENYSPTVQKAYDLICKEFSKDVPRARLAILQGPPGTGKSHMIRSFLNSIQDCIFVLLPPSYLHYLENPSCVHNILDVCNNLKKPIIFILEDADACLMPRGMDTQNSISSLLNMTDGILGTLLNARIIATSNVAVADMDPAVMRPGRLLIRETIGKLSAEQSQRVLDRLNIDNTITIESEHSLAEIYAMAINAEHNNEPKKVRFGF